MEKYRIAVFGNDVFGEPHCDQIEVSDCRSGEMIGSAQINSRKGESVLYMDRKQKTFVSYANALSSALRRMAQVIREVEQEKATQHETARQAFKLVAGAILRGHGIEPPQGPYD